jgi:hypothetical protein
MYGEPIAALGFADAHLPQPPERQRSRRSTSALQQHRFVLGDQFGAIVQARFPILEPLRVFLTEDPQLCRYRR